ncbi:hypothetical protein DQQ10_25025 [Pseudochryseolinea flava]|uniref:Uncharacterized protein n=1 Tax=Pseudochryseolinea flava TaxID=2059302 RepID=A0A364XW15_9BACT|nr:hypothetical protein DQQ10_25025 [Pseudochryseolinea flava]
MSLLFPLITSYFPALKKISYLPGTHVFVYYGVIHEDIPRKRNDTAQSRSRIGGIRRLAYVFFNLVNCKMHE